MAIIENGLDATLMRNKMESKDALANKGALYVGTGDVTSVTHKNKQGADETTNVPKTASIAPNGGTDDGKILIADSAKLEGWKIDKIGNDNIANWTITGDKLAENFTYITSDTSSFCLQDSSNNSTPRLSFVESNNHASVALQADLKSQELEGESYTLTLPNENGTVATKEQIENGDIIAKNAANAANAGKTSFSNSEWQDGGTGSSIKEATIEVGSSYQIRMAVLSPTVSYAELTNIVTIPGNSSSGEIAVGSCFFQLSSSGENQVGCYYGSVWFDRSKRTMKPQCKLYNLKSGQVADFAVSWWYRKIN